MHRHVLFFILLLLVGSCSSDNSTSELQQATGKPGDVLLLMDSLQWKGELGQELRKILTIDVPGLPRSEPMFNVIWVHPNKKIKLLTQIRNLVYVFTLDQRTEGTRVITENLSEETLTKIKSDTAFYLVNKKDEYSRGQEVLYLFANTTNDLIKHLKRDGHKIQNFFNTTERKRAIGTLKRSARGFSENLQNQYGFQLSIPSVYKVADGQKDFIWMRSPETEIDKNIFIARKPYQSEYQLLPDSIIAWREALCRHFIFEDPSLPNSYLTTEKEIPFNPVKAQQVNLNDKFAMELRGLWRTNTRTMGGPFISYTFVSDDKTMLYYIEGFVYSPGKKQRELIRDIEAIAFTFHEKNQEPNSQRINYNHIK